MMVIVDTCVWVQVLRRGKTSDDHVVRELHELIREMRVQLVGPVREELLSAVRVKKQFLELRDHLRAFPDLALSEGDFETAAEFFNLCRSKGIQGSNTDFLLCALSARHDLTIFTVDGDFKRYADYLPVRLHDLR
ncbi:MAG: PIN domain-containing protein [Desulfuromonadales bacterium]